MVPGTELAPTLDAINRETHGRKSVRIPIQAHKPGLPGEKPALPLPPPRENGSCGRREQTQPPGAAAWASTRQRLGANSTKCWQRWKAARIGLAARKKKLLPPLLSAPHQEIALSTTRSLPGLQGAGWRGSPTGAFPTGSDGVGGSCGAAPSPPQCQELPPTVPSCSHSC